MRAERLKIDKIELYKPSEDSFDVTHRKLSVTACELVGQSNANFNAKMTMTSDLDKHTREELIEEIRKLVSLKSDAYSNAILLCFYAMDKLKEDIGRWLQ